MRSHRLCALRESRSIPECNLGFRRPPQHAVGVYLWRLRLQITAGDRNQIRAQGERLQESVGVGGLSDWWYRLAPWPGIA